MAEYKKKIIDNYGDPIKVTVDEDATDVYLIVKDTINLTSGKASAELNIESAKELRRALGKAIKRLEANSK